MFLAVLGQEKVVKVVVEDIDEERRLVTFKAFEGHLIEEYKALKATSRAGFGPGSSSIESGSD
ncbi:hypothetical protein RND71_038557 [Anisodus tanguticus]|uniref:Bet v I/Major latex protein domain-containing protein n=1 Tax=Anisodus tanguticus TaxID=243964 RepID=A0AAE1R0A0_9SOLA|nr:hypothetical protein RND71_038557 [Anisodus tanguticus]